jgi:heme/copper-type cytochrome/quinol oxidase subunit 1
MNALQTPKHNKVRAFLRLAGPVTGGVGLLFNLIGMVSFFSAFGGGGPPKFFWCCFVGMPLMFAGGVMCLFGFMGALARYSAAEQVPVATDAVNDLAEGTQPAIRTVARAVAEGIDEARQNATQQHEPPPRGKT